MKVVQKNDIFGLPSNHLLAQGIMRNIDIMLSKNNPIVSESESVAKIFNKYFNEIAEGIGFNYPIPENFDKDDVTLSMIKRYDDHPSIMAIKSFCTQGQSLDFVHVTPNDIKSCIVNLDSKKIYGLWWDSCKTFKGWYWASFCNDIKTYQHVHWWMYISGFAKVCRNGCFV